MHDELDTSFNTNDAQHGGSTLVSPLSSLPPSSTFVQQWIDGPHNTRFYVRTYTAAPARATLVFVHGFIEHVARYEHVFPRWQERGINVFAFDLRGFGRTALDRERSPNSRYGKTSGQMQLGDLDWAVEKSKEVFGTYLPVYVMGHSMGGGIALDYAMHLNDHSKLSGVIVSAPLLLQTSAAPKIARWVGEKVSHLTPYSLIPAPVRGQDMTHDSSIAEAYMKDPLVVRKGSLKGISDMLNRGEEILSSHYKTWPRELPLLILHGTQDKVTSHAASQRLHDALDAMDKHISLYEDGFHELHNEPSPVKEKFVDECISWIESRLPLNPTGGGASETSAVPESPAPRL